MRKPNYSPEQQKALIEALMETYGNVVTMKQVNEYVAERNLPAAHFVFKEGFSTLVSRGQYRIGDPAPVAAPKKKVVSAAVAEAAAPVEMAAAPAMVAQVVTMHTKRALNLTESFVPETDPNFVPFGFYTSLKKIIASGIFYPIYVTGLSGNGKTLMIEQVCASLGRECVRVNITKRTDEMDLIGTYELIDGNSIRREGPVITAMRRGAVLLLDETDYGSEDILCLNGVLEGKPYFDKKTGEVIHPTKGFTVIATANTKGKGCDDGRFIGANVLNEAFLERFAITVEQEYPDPKTETRILNKTFASYGVTDEEFVEKLVAWAGAIRKSFDDGAVDEIISTRRLVHIAKAYSIFNNRKKSIELCLNRFDAETKISFLDLYTKIDAKAGNEVDNDKEVSA